jgi:hypothetical protein
MLTALTVGIVIAAQDVREAQPVSSRVVLARVVGAGDRSLVDLGPDDFAVSEGGREREVLTVYPADYPVLVLLDDGAAGGDLESIRAAVARFVGKIGQRAVALGTLARPPDILVPLGDDRAAIVAALDRLTSNPTSEMAPVEAIANAAREVLRAKVPFAAIIVVSARPIDAGPPHAQGPDTDITDILASRSIVHVIGRRLPAGTPGDSGADPARNILHGLTGQTRGEYTTVFSAASYSVALDRLAERLGAETMIEYLVPPGAGTGDVQIGVRTPGARVVGLGVSR